MNSKPACHIVRFRRKKSSGKERKLEPLSFFVLLIKLVKQSALLPSHAVLTSAENPSLSLPDGTSRVVIYKRSLAEISGLP